MNIEKINLLLDEHNKKILKHDETIEELKEEITRQNLETVEIRQDLKNLCKSVDQLTSVMKYLITIFSSFFVGFFIYMVQNHFVIK